MMTKLSSTILWSDGTVTVKDRGAITFDGPLDLMKQEDLKEFIKMMEYIASVAKERIR